MRTPFTPVVHAQKASSSYRSHMVLAFGVWMCCFFAVFMITADGVSGKRLPGPFPGPCLAKKTTFPPSTLVIYNHDNFTGGKDEVLTASVSGNRTKFDLGRTHVFYTPLRESEVLDSPELGRIAGKVVFMPDETQYTDYTYVIHGPYNGTISAEGTLDKAGNGAVAVTGGTGDFTWAKGYATNRYVSGEVPFLIYEHTFCLKYGLSR